MESNHIDSSGITTFHSLTVGSHGVLCSVLATLPPTVFLQEAGYILLEEVFNKIGQIATFS